MQAPARRLGILAGGGSLPREIAACAAARGQPVQIIALEGQADEDFGTLPVTTVNWGQLGRLVRVLKSADCQDLVIVGRVRRPNIFKLKTDLGFFRNLPALLKLVTSGGDDSVLRHVVRFFEDKGFTVVGPADVAPELLIGPGNLGRHSPGAAEASDMALGLDVVAALGPFDIGQSVVVSGGRLEAVEGAEGTDGMLKRVARQRGRPGGRPGGTLVKRPKPGQELRIDLPAIGPDTVSCAAEAGLSGISVLAGRVLAARRTDLVARADAAGLFVTGVAGNDAQHDLKTGDAAGAVMAFRQVSRRRPSGRDVTDFEKGARVLRVMSRFGAGRMAVVTRKYVLAVESGEGLAAVFERVAGLRQWGETRRRGAAVLASRDDLDVDVIAAVARAGLAGLAVMSGSTTQPMSPGVIAAADKAGLFLVSGGGEA